MLILTFYRTIDRIMANLHTNQGECNVAKVTTDVEQAIIDAAIILFSEKGYAATSIRDIARAVDMTSASLYYYMNNKKDLLELIMERYLTKLIVTAEDTLNSSPSNDPETQLRNLIKHHVQSHGKHKLAALVVDSEYRSLEGTAKEKIKALRKTYEQMWYEILARGKNAGVFHIDDLKITSFALIGLCTGVAHWFREDGERTIEEIAEQYADIGLKMVSK